MELDKSKHTTSGTDLDVEGSDAELLAAGGDVLGSQHGGVGGGLVTVGLDLHTTSDTGDGLTAAGNHPELAFDLSHVVCICICSHLRCSFWCLVCFSSCSSIFLLSVRGLVLVAYVEQLPAGKVRSRIGPRRETPQVSRSERIESRCGSGKHLRKIGNVDEGVVEGSEDASNAENELTLTGLRTELDVLLGASGLSLGCHCC